MSLERIRSAIGQLHDNPYDKAAWDELEDAVTGGGLAGDEVTKALRQLERCRLQYERLRSWHAVAQLFELELSLQGDTATTGPKHADLARIYHEELCRSEDALTAYRRALQQNGDERSRTAIAEIERARERWQESVERSLAEAREAPDKGLRARLLLAAADTALRYGPRDGKALKEVLGHVKRAIEASPTSARALGLAALAYTELRDWKKLAATLAELSAHGATKDDKIAAAQRLAQLAQHQLKDDKRTLDAFQLLFDLDPSHNEALGYLVDYYSQKEDWEHLVALYEDQLHSGAVKPSEELGVWVQIAMLNWKTLARPDAAEAYFEKVRRVDPTHAGMLQFFRERCLARGDNVRLMTILTDAQRAQPDGEGKRAIAEEIAKLAEGQENARRAIEQYKTILRSDPDNAEARARLKALYLETESFNALVELYRQELQRLPKDDKTARMETLRRIAAIYRERLSNDTALLAVLQQILQLDETDIEAVRGLVGVFESLARWRDLLAMQQKLAELTDNPAERVALLRAVARRWLDQFSNVQNAITAYEQLLAVQGGDVEAREKLRELYEKRRAFPKLYELYEQQLDETEGAARTEVLMKMARLAAERLGRADDAIRLLKEVLVLAPATALAGTAGAPAAPGEGVLDTLEKLAERQEDWRTVAYVVERRIDQSNDEKKLVLLQKLGDLFSGKLEDHDAARRTWRRVLDLSPGHKRALRVLRQAFVDAGDWDGLEELYASQNDHEGLADFLSTTADRVKDDGQRVELSFRAARVYEAKLSAPERASRSYDRVLSIDPKNVAAAKALLPLYEAEEKWSRLPGLYAVLLDTTEDIDDKIDILHKMADVTGGPLANKAGALGYARQAYELRPDEPGLRRLQQWSQQSGEWGVLVDVLEEKLEREQAGGVASRELRLMLARVYAHEIGKVDEAVKIYRGLVEGQPDDEKASAVLEKLLRASDRRDDLRWLLELKVERASGEQRARALEEWAAVEEEVFGEPARAVALLRRLCAETPGRVTALALLTRLLLGLEDWAGAIETMSAERDAVEGDRRRDLETDIARLELDKLGRAEPAYEACLRALACAPGHPPVVALLERLMEDPAVRLRVAETLEGVYASTGQALKRVGALRALLEGEDVDARRLELCARLADVQERDLGDLAAAFDVVLNTLLEAPGEIDLWDRAARLADKAGRPTDLAGAYRKHLGADAPRAERDAVALEVALQIELCDRAATLHEDRLGDLEGAVRYLERMLEIDPRHERAFVRLRDTFNSLERWGDLEQLYCRRVDVAQGDAERIELQYEVAVLAEEVIGDDDKAIGYLERVLQLDPLHHAAVQALERLYGRRQRYEKLAALLEARLDRASDDQAVDIRLNLVDLYLHALEQPDRVLEHLETVLRIKPESTDGRQLAEECLEVPALRQPVAALLDGVYETRDDVRNLVRVLEVRLEGATGDAARRELLQRIALLRDDRLKDDPGAFEALCKLLPLEPEDATVRERLLQVGRRLSEHAKVAEALREAAARSVTTSVRGEMLMEAARLLREQLDKPVHAEKVYREVLTLDPDDADLVLPAARALAEIYDEWGRHAALADVLGVQVRLVDDPDQRRQLYERIAALYEEVLDDRAKAIEAWKARLGDDLGDVAALRALERLYEQSEQWRPLVESLRQLEQATGDSDERRRCMIKGAQVLAERLDETSEAVNAWRAVLDDFGPEPETLAALSKLYRKAARWDDLAEVLDVWLSLTDELAERVELYAGLGDARREHLGDPQGALDAYRQVLLLDPSHGGARVALEEMLAHPDADIKRSAAEIIGPLYEADGDAERLLKVLAIEVDSTFEPAQKLEILSRALQTAEDTLRDARKAFDYAARGVRESIGLGEVGDWIARAERLGGETGRFADLLDLYESVIDEMLDAEVQQRTRLRAGELARTRLEDRARAVRHYRAALEAQGEDRRALVALEELYAETGEDAALLEILQRRAEAAEGDGERLELLLRAAALQAGPLGERDAAIQTYEDVLDLRLDERATQALEKLYADAAMPERLVGMYERQLEADEGGRAPDLRVKTAAVALDQLRDPARALEELGFALDVDGLHAGAVALLERALGQVEEPEHKAQAAEMLEPVYMRTADWGKLQRVLEARLETSHDPTERAELFRRLGTLYEEQLEDYPAALETIAKLLREDPSDEEIWREVERLGRVLGAESDKRVAEIYAAALDEVGADDPRTASLAQRTGELFASAKDAERALRWYRRAYEFNRDARDLFDAIDGLLVELGRHEERVTHYRAALEHTFDDAQRVPLLHTIADVQRSRLDRPEDAIATLRSVLDVDERDARALDALTILLRTTDQRAELAELLERRADLAEADEEGAKYRIELAQLLGERPDDREAAIDQLERVVDALPFHEGALRELEKLLGDADRKQRVIDILRPLYQRAANWRGIVRLNEEQLGLVSDEIEQVRLHREIATLWEEQGQDAERAFAALGRAFDLGPDDDALRAELERLAAEIDAWDGLADAYEAACARVEDEHVKRALLAALADVCDRRLDDPRRALRALADLSGLDPNDPGPLDRIDALCMLLGDWNTLAAVLERKAVHAPGDEERAELWRRVGGIRHEMLRDAAGAIEALERSVEVDAGSREALDRLIDLYQARDDAEAVARTLERRIEASDAGEEAELRHELLLRAAKVYEERLGRRGDAVRVLERALEARPGDADLLRTLERLYRAEGMHDALLGNLETQAEVSATPAERVALRHKIGELHLGELSSPFDALEQYRAVLELARDDERALAAVRRIADEHEDLRLEATLLLEPALTGAARWRDLVEVLELRAGVQVDPGDRARTLAGVALVLEEQLDDPRGALAALLRALEHTPGEAQLHEDAGRLCELGGSWERYGETLERLAGAAEADAGLAGDLFGRLGRLADERLGDHERAIRAYARAVELSEDPRPLLAALDRLYVATGDAESLAKVLERRAEVETGDATQAEILFRLAVLQLKSFGEKRQGLGTLRMVVDLNPEHAGARRELEDLTGDADLFEEAAEALDVIYRVAQDSAARARLRSKRIDYTPSPAERVRLRLELAQMLEDESFDTKSAQDVLEQALSDDPTDTHVLAQLERLASANAAGTEGARAWARAAGALGRAVTDAAKGGDAEVAPDQAVELLLRASRWYAERAGDGPAAEGLLRAALERDGRSADALLELERLQRAGGRERDLVATLRRMAELAHAGEIGRDAGELRREAKIIAESTVGDAALSEEIVREILEADDRDVWALVELSTICERKGADAELYALLRRRIDLGGDAAELRGLRHRAAALAAGPVGDDEVAVELYEQAFDDDPSDEEARAGLRRLYAKLGRHQAQLELLGRLAQQADRADERARLRLESARLCMDVLGAPTEAIEQLHAALDEAPGNEEAVELLSGLLEREQRDDELAELLERQIQVASERAEREGELAFRLKLAELYETRLNDAERAIDAYEGVLSLSERHRVALEGLARLHERRGEQASAAERYEQLVQAAETTQDASRLALKARDLFGAAGDEDAAARVLEAALVRLDEAGLDGDGAAVSQRAGLRDALRALYRARTSWSKLAALIEREAEEAGGDEERVLLFRKAAEIHANERDDHEAAARLLARAAGLRPDDRELMLALCDEYTAARRGDQAIAVLSRVVESYGGRRSKELADIHLRIASAHLAQGESDAALADLEAARKMDPGSIKILFELGQLSLRLSDETSDAEKLAEHLKRAGNSFRSLLLQRLEGETPVSKAEVFYYLAEVNRREQDTQKAIQMLERALATDKNLVKAQNLLDELRR
jgi:tetratricopeptide (TPR) repeat protein